MTFQKGDLLNLPQLLASSSHVKSSKLYKPRKDKITGFHYFKTQLHGNQVFLNVAEQVKNGKVRRYLYSVISRIKKAIRPTSVGYTPVEVTFR